LPDPKFTATKESALVSLAKKEIALISDSKIPTLRLTNEYGNAISYPLTLSAFERLHAELWAFIKESQH
jgi:hypothetical protein